MSNGDKAGLAFLYPTWSNWEPLTGVSRDSSDPAAIANSDGRLQVFVIGTDNRLYTKWQNTAGATTNWSSYLCCINGRQFKVVEHGLSMSR